MEEIKKSLPTLVIVGRPNVGKSSLFNAILKRRHAIVHFDSGVTRDRVSTTGVYNGKRYQLVDTGGLAMYAGEKKGVGFWDTSIEKQVETAIEEADTILFVTDVNDGLTPLDQEIAARLRATGRDIILVVNKVDDYGRNEGVEEFLKLGFKKVYPVSSLHRKGIQNLLDGALAEFAKNAAETEEHEPRLRIAVVGRPNAGKSSLVNKMLGAERVIVSDVAGTTRDSIDVDFTLPCGDEDVPATLIDTAGLRRKSKIDSAVERYSMMRASEAVEKCDIVLFLVTSDQFGATAQDKTIAKMIGDAGKPCIIVANKWDTCSGLKQQDVLKEIRYTLPKLVYAPVVFTCAISGYNVKLLYSAIAEVRAQMSIKVSTAMVNRILEDAENRYSAPIKGTKAFKIYYGTMIKNPPPTIALFVNDPKLLADNYKVYLENYIRKAFGFTGMPIRLEFRARERRELVFIEHKATVKKQGKNRGVKLKAKKTTVYLRPDSKKRGVKKNDDPEKNG